MEWWTCPHCGKKSYAPKEKHQEHIEDCPDRQVAQTRRKLKEPDLDPNDCPKCPGRLTIWGSFKMCSICKTVVGGGNAYTQ